MCKLDWTMLYPMCLWFEVFVEKFAVLSQESCIQRKLGLWSILSTANVVETFEQSFVAQITPSDSNCVYALSLCNVDQTDIWS